MSTEETLMSVFVPRKSSYKMASNLTGPGMENFNVHGFEGSSQNFLIPKANKSKNVHPSGNNSYAPGSPKPILRDTQQHHDILFDEVAAQPEYINNVNFREHYNQRLNPFPPPPIIDDTKKEQNSPFGSSMADSKDEHIRYLTQMTEMLKLSLHESNKKLMEKEKSKEEMSGLQNQLAILSREKEQLMRMNEKMNEQIFHLHQTLKQKSEQELNPYNGVAERDNEICKLRTENSSLKRRVESLSTELSICRDSLMANEHSRNSTASSSLASTQTCSKELDTLHHVVDSLKSAVIQQRHFLLKLKIPQMSNKSTSELKGQENIGTNNMMSGTTPSQGLYCLRQGEEGAAPPFSEQQEKNDLNKLFGLGVDALDECYEPPMPLPHLNNSHVPLSGGKVVSHDDFEAASKRHQETVMQLAGFDVDARASIAQNSAYSGSVDEDVVKMNNGPFAVNQSDLLCLNSTDGTFNALSGTSQLGGNVSVKSPSPKRDPPAVQQNAKEEVSQIPHLPGRKISRSEILSQRPVLNNPPMRSKTENLDYNRQVRAQLQPEPHQQWQPMLPSVAALQHEAVQSRVRQPATWPPTVQQRMANSSQSEVQSPVQSSHYAAYRLPGHPKPSVAHGDRGVMLAGGALPDSPNVPDFASPNRIDSPLSDSPREHTKSDAKPDRLCPVCNRDFGSVSIDQFQSHVLECFDNENGPETMVAEDSGPQRLCPMCNTSFGEDMPQSEYEKHVHSHFGEDPGENFEVLRP